MHLLVVLSSLLLLLEAVPNDLPYYRTREEFINRAKEGRKGMGLEEFKKTVGNGLDAEAIDRTSKFLERRQQASGATVLTAEQKANVVEMDRLMKGRVEVEPSLEEINEKIAKHLYGGDIVLTAEQIAEIEKGGRPKRGAPMFVPLWPKDRPIYYNLTADFSQTRRDYIKKRLGELASKTCLTFEENNSGKALIQLVYGGGCWSYVGYYWPDQLRNLSLGNGCDRSVQHEFMHALGFGHTQTRTDRDNFVAINTASIDPDHTGNFEKAGSMQDLKVSYDYASAMHYGAYDFSKDGSPTIVPSDIDYMTSMGSRREPSFSDYKQLNTLYKCGDHCPTPVKCENGGYPHPKNCGVCECTNFHKGARCEITKPKLTLTERSDDYEIIIRTDQDYSSHNAMRNVTYDPADYATYTKMLEMVYVAPRGRKLWVTLNKFRLQDSQFDRLCAEQCNYAGIEFIDNPAGDLTLGGKKFCCRTREGHSFITTSNVLGFRGWMARDWKYEIDFKVEVADKRADYPPPEYTYPDGSPIN